MSKKNASLEVGDIILSWLITTLVFLADFRDLSANLNVYESLNWAWFAIGIAASGAWCTVNAYDRTKLRAVLPLLRRIFIIELGFSLLLGQSFAMDIIQIAVVLAAAQLLFTDMARLKHDITNSDGILAPAVALVVATFTCAGVFWIESTLFIRWSVFKEPWFIALVAVLDVMAIILAIFTRATWLPEKKATNAKKNEAGPLQPAKQVKTPVPRAIAACLAVMALATLPGIFLGIIEEVSHYIPGIASQQWLMLVLALIAIVLVAGSMLYRGLFRNEPKTALYRKKWLAFWSIAAVALFWFVPYVWKSIDFTDHDVPFIMNVAVHVAMLYGIPVLAAVLLYRIVNVQLDRKALLLMAGAAAAAFCFSCIGFVESFKGTGEYIMPSIEGVIMLLGLLGMLYLDIGERQAPKATIIDTPRQPMFAGNFAMLGIVVCLGIEFKELYQYVTSNPPVNLQYLLLYPAVFVIAALLGWRGSRSGRSTIVLVIAIASMMGVVGAWFMPVFVSINRVIVFNDATWHLVPMNVIPFVAGFLFSLASDGRYRLDKDDLGWAIFSAALGAVLGWAGYIEMRAQNAVTLAVSFVALCIVIAAIVCAWVRSSELDIAKPIRVIIKKKPRRDARGK